VTDDVDYSDFRKRLLQRRDELLGLQQTGRSAAGTVELDQSKVGHLSRMDALQAQAMSQEGERRRELELQRIKAALKRLEEGEYGYCRECDEPIARQRLELNPAVALCISCAERMEQL